MILEISRDFLIRTGGNSPVFLVFWGLHHAMIRAGSCGQPIGVFSARYDQLLEPGHGSKAGTALKMLIATTNNVPNW